MANDNVIDSLIGRHPRRISNDPTTAKVVRVDGGVFVVPLEGDTRHPIGPCRGLAVDVDDIVLLIWTDERPWVAQVDA